MISPRTFCASTVWGQGRRSPGTEPLAPNACFSHGGHLKVLTSVAICLLYHRHNKPLVVYDIHSGSAGQGRVKII